MVKVNGRGICLPRSVRSHKRTGAVPSSLPWRRRESHRSARAQQRGAVEEPWAREAGVAQGGGRAIQPRRGAQAVNLVAVRAARQLGMPATPSRQKRPLPVKPTGRTPGPGRLATTTTRQKPAGGQEHEIDFTFNLTFFSRQ